MFGIAISGFFCSSVSQSGEKGDKFYAYLKNGDFEMIVELLDEQAIKAHPKEKWMDLLESRSQYWGKLVTYKNTGFHTETTDGITITKLNYTVDNTNGKVYERIDFVKRGNEYKILAYEFNPDINKLGSSN